MMVPLLQVQLWDPLCTLLIHSRLLIMECKHLVMVTRFNLQFTRPTNLLFTDQQTKEECRVLDLFQAQIILPQELQDPQPITLVTVPLISLEVQELEVVVKTVEATLTKVQVTVPLKQQLIALKAIILQQESVSYMLIINFRSF